MGGCAFDYDLDFPPLCSEVKNVVLVGPIDDGRSATGNSIIGRKVFDSMLSPADVTTTCQLQRTVLEDGLILNVIDTFHYMFDDTADPEFVEEELAECVNMANNCIHSVLVVLPLGIRCSGETAAGVERLWQFFGEYMIVIFSGGETISRNVSLDYYLARNCSEPIARILELCGNRCVVFDNMTKDEVKKSQQLKELLSLVEVVVNNNGGKPYSNDQLYVELKKVESEVSEASDQAVEVNSSEISEFDKKLNISYEKQLKQITETVEARLRESTLKLEMQLAEEKVARLEVEARLRESTLKLEKQLAEEHAARLEAEAMAQAAQMISNDLVLQLSECLERAQRKVAEELVNTSRAAEKKLRKTHRKTEEEPRKSFRDIMEDLTDLRTRQREIEEQLQRRDKSAVV